MILTTALFFSALGFVAWIAGTVFDKVGIQVVGAMLIVGVGAVATTGSLEHKVGQTEVTNSTTNETTISYNYQPVETPARMPVGVVIMLLGSLMVLQAFNDSSGGIP